MTDTHNAAILNQDAFNNGLRKWAKGRLPYMAGAELLISTGIGYRVRGMFNTNLQTVWPSWDSLTDSAAAGVWSGGERAIIRLALSMFQGELDDTFWRLDPTNQAAFLAALQVGMKGQEYASPTTDHTVTYEQYGEMCDVITKVKNDDRSLDNDEYAGAILAVLGMKVVGD